jgi:hypothetical protein
MRYSAIPGSHDDAVRALALCGVAVGAVVRTRAAVSAVPVGPAGFRRLHLGDMKV